MKERFIETVSLPRDMMVIRELSVLLNVLCSSSRAEIIFSIWARLSGLAVPVLVLGRPALVPAVIVPVVVLSVILVVPSTPAALVLRSQYFRYWLGFSAEGFCGTAVAWVRPGRGCGVFTKAGKKKYHSNNSGTGTQNNIPPLFSKLS